MLEVKLSQQQRKQPREQSPQVIIVSIMCAILMIFVGQSLSVATTTSSYDVVQARGREYTTDPPWWEALKDSQTINTLLTDHISDQKQTFEQRISSLWKKESQALKGEQLKVPEVTWVTESQSEIVSEPTYHYATFEELQLRLENQICEYELPIDITNANLASAIQWWLSHCLITVSGSHKIYPSDALTNKTLRIISDRAWFVVNMEYATSSVVVKEDFISFLNTLQQHHKLPAIPVVSLSDKVTREEYLTLLYQLFYDAKHSAHMTGSTQQIMTWGTSSDQGIQLPSLGSLLSGDTKDITQKLTQFIVSQPRITWESIDVPQKLKTNLLHYVNTSFGEPSSWDIGTWSIWIDYDALSLTWDQLKNWLGRS